MSEDLESLQGSWKVTALEMDGNAMPAAMLAESRVLVQGNRFTSTGMGAEYSGTIALTTSTHPRQLDMHFDAGPEKGNVNLCIYEIAGDTWRVCIATRGSGRPAAFTSPPDSGFAVQTLSRDVPPHGERGIASTTAAAPAPEFDGEWRLVSGFMDGKAMDNSVVAWVRRVSLGNHATVYAGPQILMQFEFTTGSAQSPKTIDYRHTAGANNGKMQQGIYEFDGELLRIHMSPPGSARPANFDAGPGTLTVWKRA